MSKITIECNSYKVIKDDNNKWILYIITCPEDKHYVGITSHTVKDRFYKHKSRYKDYKQKNIKLLGLYKAFDKYEKLENEFKINEICVFYNKREALDAEEELIKALRTRETDFGYNIS